MMPRAGQSGQSDPHDLERFVQAQASVYDRVRAELAAGRKSSHWMWFVFPQMRGLGRSHTAHRYGIASREEAAAYLGHPILGPRLIDCTRLVNAVRERSIGEILGYPDDLKFHSSMTLFDAVQPEERVFAEALDKYFGGERDANTLRLLDSPAP